MYESLHSVSFSQWAGSDGRTVYSAIVSHRGLARAQLPIKCQTELSASNPVVLQAKIKKQFKTWDKRWAGAFPGPACDYNASTPKSPTGFTWEELEEHRLQIAITKLKQKGFSEPDFDQLFRKPLFTHEKFYKPYNDQEEMNGLSFTAIDFETANRHQTSACSLGVAKVVNGEIIESKYWLFKPVPFEMELANQGVHGISLLSLMNKPAFGEIWDEIKPYLDGQPIVAHNCEFDLAKLLALVEIYDLDLKLGETFCTMNACKSFWPKTSSGLKNMTKIFGIDIKHHDAESDAVASAQLAIKLAQLTSVDNLNDIYRNLPPAFISKERREKSKQYFTAKGQSESALIATEVSTNSDFKGWSWIGKKVVVSGNFKNYEREEIKSKLEELGCRLSSSVSGATHVLLAGDNLGPAKLETARQNKVIIMTEEEFENLLS